MADILQQIVQKKQERLCAQKEHYPLKRIQSELAEREDLCADFLEALDGSDRPRIIAEIKRASPSKGVLRADLDPVELAQAYQRGGASALSVLTEEDFFLGSGEDLQRVRAQSPLPILRKDFILEEYQLWESKLMGASAVLLIVSLLEPNQLQELHTLAEELGLAALFEVHTLEEAEKLFTSCRPQIVGVNNRNLCTFQVDLAVSRQLRQTFADHSEVQLWVSESGIQSSAEVQELFAVGFGAFLVGESLLTSQDPAAQLHALLPG